MENLIKRENYLFLIGIDQYQDSSHKTLNNSVFDCKNLIEVLVRNYGFKIAGELYNEQATRRKIIEGLTELQVNLIPEDALFIYYAGHGSFNNGTRRGYWIPYEASNTVGDFIPNSQIKEIIEDINVKHIFLVSDSCFSGSFLLNNRSSAQESRHYKKLDDLQSRWYLSSGNEEPVDDGKAGDGSPFSKALLKVLSDNTKKYMSVLELVNEVKKITSTRARQLPVFGQIQVNGNANGEMIFIRLNNGSTPEITREEFEEYSKVYGFVQGQQHSINLISKKYPSLKVLFFIAQKQFEKNFNGAIQNITNALKEVFGSRWNQYQKAIDQELKKSMTINKEILTYENSILFLKAVENRANGIIESPFREIILTNVPEFKEHPIQEYLNGYKQFLNSTGHHKSKGLNFRIEIPLSWSINEGLRPNIIWNLKNKKRNIGLSIIVYNILSSIDVTEDEFNTISPEEYENYIREETPDSAFIGAFDSDKVKNFNKKRIKVDRQPCIMAEFESSMERVGIEIHVYCRMYIIFYKHYQLWVQFNIFDSQIEISQIVINEYRLFFDLIMNSVVIFNQY